MEPKLYDNLKFSSDKEIKAIIGEEVIYYSNKVYKYNKYSFRQERNLVLTNNCLYNFSKKKLKRDLKYKEMLGITFSNQFNDFVIHALEGFDFLFQSEDKLIIIYIIATCYELIMNKPITLCDTKNESPKKFLTPKGSKKKDPNSTKMDIKYIIDTRTFIEDNPPPKMTKRSLTEYGTNLANLIEFKEEKKKSTNNEMTIFSLNEKIKSINLDDFLIKGVIGRGIISKVMLSLNKKNKNFYVLKSISKSNLVFDKKEKNNFSNLKKIFSIYYSIFLNNVEFCFQTEEKFYFAFPYIEGELLYNFIKKEKSLDEKKVKHYSAIIALSIKFLHERKITNNNFSSKNIFIDKDGYLKIIPFHLGKILPLRKDYYDIISLKYYNEYTAPEIYLNLDINKKMSDWWNLGILIFEMIYGITPFYSESKKELIPMICTQDVRFPDKPIISESCKNLIKSLLNKKYNERLGFKDGFNDIKKHEFFKGFNFDAISKKKVESPYKPKIIDIKNGNINKNKIMFTYEDLVKNE